MNNRYRWRVWWPDDSSITVFTHNADIQSVGGNVLQAEDQKGNSTYISGFVIIQYKGREEDDAN